MKANDGAILEDFKRIVEGNKASLSGARLDSDGPAANAELKIDSSVRVDNIYHFKVLKLEAYPDDPDSGKPKCTLHFHFFHKLFAKTKDAVVGSLAWSYDNKTQQRLYLS